MLKRTIIYGRAAEEIAAWSSVDGRYAVSAYLDEATLGWVWSEGPDPRAAGSCHEQSMQSFLDDGADALPDGFRDAFEQASEATRHVIRTYVERRAGRR